MLSKAGTVAVPVAVEMPSGFFDVAHEIARLTGLPRVHERSEYPDARRRNRARCAPVDKAWISRGCLRPAGQQGHGFCDPPV